MGWLFAALLALHIVAAGHVLVGTNWSDMNFTSGDSLRYREIAHAHGIPYRNVDVEFPPLSWAAVKVIGAGSSPAASGRALVRYGVWTFALVSATASSPRWPSPAPFAWRPP